MTEAAKIKSEAQAYHDALRDWVEKGAASRFALSADEVVERSRPRDNAKSLGHAHFALATQLEMDGHHDAAITHFREAHRLVPESWTFRRQAWSLEKVIDGPLARFWQGPEPGQARRIGLTTVIGLPTCGGKARRTTASPGDRKSLGIAILEPAQESRADVVQRRFNAPERRPRTPSVSPAARIRAFSRASLPARRAARRPLRVPPPNAPRTGTTDRPA